MKTLMTSALIVAAGVANTQSFEDDKAVGSSELYSTLAADTMVNVEAGSANFAYQVANGSADLFSFTTDSGSPSAPLLAGARPSSTR